MKRIALLGECMIELNGKLFGSMEQAYGGDSLNTAVYLARTAGQSVAIDYISALGIDPISDGMISRWQNEGINTDFVLRDTNRQPGLYLIQLDDCGERTFLYWRNQSAARYMLQHSNLESVERHLKTVDMVYLSGISLAILPKEDRQNLICILENTAQAGTQIVFDSNYRPALWDSEEEAQQCYSQIFAFTYLALVTNDDEQALWGDSCEEDTLSRLQKSGVKKAVVKMGAAGNAYQDFASNQRKFIATTPVTNVVDTTSAGDSFNAGFLAGVLTGKDPLLSSKQGHQLASTVIQHKGAIIPLDATEHINFNVKPTFTMSNNTNEKAAQ